MATGEKTEIRGDLAGVPAEFLEAQIREHAGLLVRGTQHLLLFVGELDARGTYVMWGALSCSAWLAGACDVEVGTARSWVRVARAMRRHRLLGEAMADRAVSFGKARVLVPYLADMDPDDPRVGEVVALAASHPAAGLGRVIAAWAAKNEDPEETDERHRREQRLSWRTDPDGMVTATLRLPPLEAGKVIAQIDQRVMSDRAPTGASLAHQRAAALVAVVTGGGGSVDAELVIHVDHNGCHLADGTPVSDHAVAGLVDGAFISLLMHDHQRRPIDASPRRRHPTRRQKRVLDARQPECAEPGCTARALLQYDHIIPHPKGGPTVLANLQRLCGPHNRRKGG